MQFLVTNSKVHTYTVCIPYCYTTLSSGKAIISKMLISYPMCSKARGRQEVIIDYLLTFLKDCKVS